MNTKEVWKEIEKQIEYVWRCEIAQDYAEGRLLKEDSLKCCLYHHIRNYLDGVLEQHDLRIYPEYYIKETKQRADMAIVKMDWEREVPHIAENVEKVVAIFELKYFSKERDVNWAKSDIYKMKAMLQNVGLDCHYFFTVIYENDYRYFLDKRSTNNWAKGRVTELNAGYIDGEMVFGVNRG